MLPNKEEVIREVFESLPFIRENRNQSEQIISKCVEIYERWDIMNDKHWDIMNGEHDETLEEAKRIYRWAISSQDSQDDVHFFRDYLGHFADYDTLGRYYVESDGYSVDLPDEYIRWEAYVKEQHRKFPFLDIHKSEFGGFHVFSWIHEG